MSEYTNLASIDTIYSLRFYISDQRGDGDEELLPLRAVRFKAERQ
jgi:hypothetical protein